MAWRCDRESGRHSHRDRSHRRGSRSLRGPDGSTGLDKVSSDSSPPHSDQRRRGKGQGGIIQFRFGSFIKSCQTDQTGAWRAGIRGRSEGGARLVLLPLVETNPCADGAALSRRGQRTPTGNTRTRHMRAHHSTVLGTQTRKLRVTITPSHSWLQS